jgi:hypothetical protein
MTLLSTTTLSGSLVTIASINQTYETLMILLKNPTWATGTAQLHLRAQSSSSIQGAGSSMWNSGSNTAVVGHSGINLNVTANGNSNTAAKVGAVWMIYDYNSTTSYKSFMMGSGDDSQGSVAAGVIATNTAISQIELANQFSYSFNGGTIEIWGIK